MSIIYSYPEQGQLNADDMFIGTSAVTVGGKQKNITRNFTVQQIADFINQGAGFVDPLASDFQIPVFNQGGTKITGSIISQNTSPSNGSVGSAITIAGSLTVNTNLTASGSVTLGSGANNIILQSPTTLGGPIKDSSNTLGVSNQILISNSLGNLVWQNYEAGLTYEGTWNASTNTPALTSGQGVSGHFYIVNVAGNTNLDGNNDWHVGDWAVFFDAGGGGTAGWQKIDNTSVLTGSGTANTFAMWTANETLNDSLLSQDAGATKVIVDGLLEVKGDGASQDGRIKLNCSQNSHGVTIQSPPHSAGASYTLLLPTSVGTSGQALTTNGSDPAQLNWTTLTTPVTGTGTQNYVTKWSAGGAGIEDSTIFDDGTNVGIGTSSPASPLHVNSGTGNRAATFTSSDPSVALALIDPNGFAQIQNTGGNLIFDADRDDERSNSYIGFEIDGGGEKMRIDSTGNVGIGTTSPGEKLSVLGNSNITEKLAVGSTGAHPTYDFYNQNTAYFNGAVTLDSTFTQTGGGDSSFSGNVGIGTTAPSAKLHVYSDDELLGVFKSTDNKASMQLSDNDTTAYISVENDKIAFGPNAGTHADNLNYDLTNKRLGIGTTSPAVSLDISATDAVQMPVGTTTERGNITSPADGMFRYNNTSNSFEGYINGNWGAIGGGSSGGLVFRGTFDASTGAITGGGSLYTCPTGGPGGTVDIAVGDLYIVTTAGSFYCSGTNLNVGDEVICVTAATAGNSSVTDWNAVASGGGGLTGSGTTNYIPKFTGTTIVGNSSIYENANGNVGIGTSSPSAKLQVGDGTTDEAARIYHSDGAFTEMRGYGLLFNRAVSYIRPTGDNNKEMYFGTSGATWNNIVFDSTEYDFQTNAVSRLNIDTSGNVGIGTDLPNRKLHVSGSGSTIAIKVEATDGSQSSLDLKNSEGEFRLINDGGSFSIYDQTDNAERMRIDSAGNVGIGTDQPEVSLDLGNNTDAIRVPNGPTADRPSGILPGMIRYNTSTNEFEGYSGTLNVSGSWGALGGGAPTITKQLFQVTTAQSAFILTAGINPQDANYVNIFIDGVYQNSGTYTVATTSGTTTVTLNAAAPVGTSVEIISTT